MWENAKVKVLSILNEQSHTITQQKNPHLQAVFFFLIQNGGPGKGSRSYRDSHHRSLPVSSGRPLYLVGVQVRAWASELQGVH